MNIRMNGPTLMLDRWQTIELIDAAGIVAAVKTGCLWITMENDPRDIVLEPGDTWVLDRNGLTLVHAEVPSAVALSEQVSRQRGPMGRLHAAWRALLRRWSAMPGREWAPYY
ncbi:MAG: DUF2917 domain-containing protein [Casimicrobiaceae bacterium]